MLFLYDETWCWCKKKPRQDNIELFCKNGGAYKAVL